MLFFCKSFIPLIFQHSELDRRLVLETTWSRLPTHAWSKGEHGLRNYDETPLMQIADTINVALLSYRFTVDFILLTITLHWGTVLSEVLKGLGNWMVIFPSWSRDIPWEELWLHFAPLILLWVTKFAQGSVFLYLEVGHIDCRMFLFLNFSTSSCHNSQIQVNLGLSQLPNQTFFNIGEQYLKFYINWALLDSLWKLFSCEVIYFTGIARQLKCLHRIKPGVNLYLWSKEYLLKYYGWNYFCYSSGIGYDCSLLHYLA